MRNLVILTLAIMPWLAGAAPAATINGSAPGSSHICVPSEQDWDPCNSERELGARVLHKSAHQAVRTRDRQRADRHEHAQHSEAMRADHPGSREGRSDGNHGGGHGRSGNR